MRQTFTLARAQAGDKGRIAPADGEELGLALAGFAAEREATNRAKPERRVESWGNTVAQIYFLAADAYEQGASASIGHNRTDRYMSRAAELRRSAETILAEAKAQRDESWAARMLRAALAGYAGDESRNRYAFDAGDAFLVGQHLRAAGLPAPTSVRVVDDVSSRRTFDVDGVVYLVACPSGRGVDTTVERVAA